MAELRVVGPYRGPGERLTAETLAEELPDSWVIIANRALPTQEHDDLDLTVIGQNLIFVVENKHWGPTLRVSPGPWVVKRQPRENPTDRVSFLARKLAGLLRNRVRGYPKRDRIVESYIVLSYPGLVVDWSEAGPESDMVILLQEAAQVLAARDRSARTDSFAPARDSTIAFLDGWKERRGVPEKIGAYKINQEIAPLGRARVFAAHDDVGNFVLLRCYPMDGWGPEVDPQNLIRRERMAIQKLAESGRTLECQPVFDDDLHRWIVVPVVQKPLSNLPRLLAMSTPSIDPRTSDARQIIEFIKNAFEGLQLIHANGVLHRGISPSRVAIDANGRVKFTDFFLARVAGEETVSPSLNELADRGASFRAPECRNIIGSATPASDIYSLASSILWWLSGGNEDSFNPAVSQRGDLADVVALLRLCLTENPKQRPGVEAVLSKLDLMQPKEAEGRVGYEQEP